MGFTKGPSGTVLRISKPAVSGIIHNRKLLHAIRRRLQIRDALFLEVACVEDHRIISTLSDKYTGLREASYTPIPATEPFQSLSAASRYASAFYEPCTLLVFRASSCKLAIAATSSHARRQCFKCVPKYGWFAY
jgi:hypothetical protein